MLNEKILELKKQTEKYIYEKNIDVYIKLQTLYEYIIKDYVKTGDTEVKVIDLIKEHIPNDFKYKEDVIENVKTINKYANAGVKHFNEMKVTYEPLLVKKTLQLFNILNNYLNKNNVTRYHIDEGIFNTPKITLSKSIETKKEKVNAVKSDDIVINSGTSKTSNGFTIKNIKYDECNYKYKSIYAVIFNLLQRSKKMVKDNLIIEYEKEKGLTVDYNIVYKYEMTILALIKNNYFIKNTLKVYSADKYINEIECAIDHINKLAEYILFLMKQNQELIEIINDKSGIQIAINEESEISIYDNLENQTDREIWYSPNIRYKIDIEKDLPVLQELLEILLRYKKFKIGQVEAIAQILNGNDSEIIIMPTGSGKSLIYYFISLLQPSPTLIVEPTEILIKDQIRNLKELHNIDDCISYLNFDNYEVNLNHNFVYVTPRVLQNKNSILSLINANVDLKIANIILDEIHTISNWSHDFRPDYLMISFNLKTFLDNFRYLGFTATANYRVMKDISNQLNIDFDRIFTPIELKNNNIIYHYVNHNNEDEYINYFSEIANEIVESQEEKMIVFTKDENTNEKILQSVDNLIKHDIDVLSSKDENSYDAFVNDRRCILLSKTDMGIGINIPNVNKIMHYGIPISKSKYVQEIGRAGRGNNKAISYISFVKKEDLNNNDLKLIDLNSSIDEILSIIRENASDISLSFKQLLGHLDSYSIMAVKIKEIYENIEKINIKGDSHAAFKLEYDTEKDIKSYEICLYFLFQMGIIYNWYISNIEEKYITYDIEVSEEITLKNVKKKCINYILLFGNNKETIYNIEHFETIEDIIYELQTWYYNQFLLYHREQLVNMYEFVENSSNNNYSDEKITSILFEYFNLTSTDIDEDVDTYINRIKNNQQIIYKEEQETKEIENKNLYETNTNSYIAVIKNVLEDKKTDTNFLKFEKYLESKYDIIADLYIFTYNTLKNNSPSIARLERIIKEIGKDLDFLSYIASMYKLFNELEFKLKMIKKLKEYYADEEIYSVIYKYNEKDIIYYNYLSEIINNRLEA